MSNNEISRGMRRITPQTYGAGGASAAQGTASARAAQRLTAISERGDIDDKLHNSALNEQKPQTSASLLAGASLQGVQPIDLAPLNGASTDHLIGQLTRIEHLVSLSGEGLSGPEAQSFAIGGAMIGETIRRLRLVQSAGDRLVSGGGA